MRVHSRLRLVTNSSSETYMFIKEDEVGVQSLKDFINAVLKAGGSPMEADDLFEFELVPIPSYLDDRIEYLRDEGEEPSPYDMEAKYPNGIHDVQITVKPGVDAPADIARLLGGIFQGEEISSEW